MPKPKWIYARFSVNWTQEEYDLLKQTAEESGREMSYLVREAVRVYLPSRKARHKHFCIALDDSDSHMLKELADSLEMTEAEVMRNMIKLAYNKTLGDDV